MAQGFLSLPPIRDAGFQQKYCCIREQVTSSISENSVSYLMLVLVL